MLAKVVASACLANSAFSSSVNLVLTPAGFVSVAAVCKLAVKDALGLVAEDLAEPNGAEAREVFDKERFSVAIS